MVKRTSRLMLPTVCALVVGIALGQVAGTERNARADRADTALPFPMASRVGGNLYLQTSAECQAACLQVYRCASERLRTLTTANGGDSKLPAVVMDLDETVLNNSAFQTYLYRTGQEYSDALWENYEKNFGQDVTLIPGAKQFIDEAKALGVNIVFLSNRSEEYQASTVAVLERLEVAGSNVADRLFLKPKGGSSEKATRRDRVAARYNVQMLIGDNLRDFAEVFAARTLPQHSTSQDVLAAIEQRKLEVDRSAIHWGTNWFIVPNPVYGEWDKLIKVDPTTLMHPTSMTPSPTP